MIFTKNSLSTLLLTLAVCGPLAAQEKPTAPPATAEPTTAETWWHKMWSQVELHRSRVNTWPEAFAPYDREAVRGPFRQIVDNGWKSQNTFTDYLFDPGTNELTRAGQAKLYHVLTQVPPHRRQVYVLEAATQEETATRVVSVYRSIAQIAPESSPCAVMTTRIVPRGGEGWYLYDVERSYRQNMPQPRLLNSGPGGGGMSDSNNGNNNNNGINIGSNNGTGGNY